MYYMNQINHTNSSDGGNNINSAVYLVITGNNRQPNTDIDYELLSNTSCFYFIPKILL